MEIKALAEVEVMLLNELFAAVHKVSSNKYCFKYMLYCTKSLNAF
jgi:hypothetical protein